MAPDWLLALRAFASVLAPLVLAGALLRRWDRRRARDRERGPAAPRH